jgi:hypothetical protein
LKFEARNPKSETNPEFKAPMTETLSQGRALYVIASEAKQSPTLQIETASPLRSSQ